MTEISTLETGAERQNLSACGFTPIALSVDCVA